MSKQYHVSIYFDGGLDYNVEAETYNEAQNIAWERFENESADAIVEHIEYSKICDGFEDEE